LVLVKVETSEAGLHGVGCATFTQRPRAVVTAIEEYLRPLLLGRNPDDIEDIWQAAFLSSYWRSGPVLNNALAGVDMALWDIKGKRAGVPAYQLFGGRARRSADVYVHANGRDIAELEDRILALQARGFRYFRCQIGATTSRLALEQAVWEPRVYARSVVAMFERLRENFGEGLELLHDVHERLPPILAIQLAKDLERFKLFFLEDVFAPEDQDYLRMLRAQCAIPIAMGELYVSPQEYVPVIRERLIDFIRCHISDIGGLTPARKLAALAEFFAVRTAWHGPGDASPVAHAANLQLDLTVPNFGIQEATLFGEASQEVFPGMPEISGGAMWSNDRPGLGVDIDEEAAARFPFPEHPLNGAWPEIRLRDGTVVKP
jgi:mannonate dehydratase